MNIAPAEKIAHAILYEGYLLYPYRPDSTKNRQRWNFGTLFPPAAATIGLSSFHAEVLVNGNDDSQLELRVRFLQFTSAEHESIAEAIERYWEPPLVRLGDLLAGTQLSFAFAAGQMEMDGKPRRLQDIHGNIGLRAVRVSPGLFQVALEVANASPSTAKSREDALLYCLTSAHAILQVEKGSPSPCSNRTQNSPKLWDAAATLACSLCSAEMRQQRIPCWFHQSSSTTTHKSHRKVQVIFSTGPKWMKC